MNKRFIIIGLILGAMVVIAVYVGSPLFLGVG